MSARHYRSVLDAYRIASRAISSSERGVSYKVLVFFSSVLMEAVNTMLNNSKIIKSKIQAIKDLRQFAQDNYENPGSLKAAKDFIDSIMAAQTVLVSVEAVRNLLEYFPEWHEKYKEYKALIP